MRVAAGVLFFYFCSLFVASLNAASTETFASQLKILSKDPYWHVLLHYQYSLRYPEKSIIDDARFFLADKGRVDAFAELKATVAAFRDPNSMYSMIGLEQKPIDEPVQCRFIARYHWLTEKLKPLGIVFPKRDCFLFDKFQRALAAQRIVMIYAADYMGSPASLFGHTFLRVDSELTSKLLATAVDYGAITEGADPLWFAIGGIFGAFDSMFSTLPYYKKVNEYHAMEFRSMWEFPTNLNEAQRKRFLWHLWELQGILADYFFFDENCSYNLLFLLEAAVPGLRLTNRFPFYVLPLDTLRVVADAGLLDLENKIYRPARTIEIRVIAQKLNSDELAAGFKIGENVAQVLPVLQQSAIAEERKGIVLDFATQWLQFKRAGDLSDRDGAREVEADLLEIALPRSRYAPKHYPIQVPATPLEGHDSARFSFGLQFNHDMQIAPDFIIGLAPAYHGLSDPDRGFTKGAEIRLLASEWGVNPVSSDLYLERFTLLRITSLPIRSRLFRARSYRIEVGLRKGLYGNFGIGMTWGNVRSRIHTLAVVKPWIRGGSALKDLGFEGGIELGTVMNLLPALKFRLHVEALLAAWPQFDTIVSAHPEFIYQFSRNNALRTLAMLRWQKSSADWRVRAEMLHYF